jgi:hypothetical protein
MLAMPQVKSEWDASAHRLRVKATFPDHAAPQKNELWWSANRHPDYTIAMEYDRWESTPLRETGPGTFEGEATLSQKPRNLDFVTVHQHTANGSTLTISSPLLRVDVH